MATIDREFSSGISPERDASHRLHFLLVVTVLIVTCFGVFERASSVSASSFGGWVIRNTPADNDWKSVTYGNGVFVAVADTGTTNRVMTSTDGITWTGRTAAANNDWKSVTFGNGLFVAVANSGTGNRVMTSPNGITWTIRTTPVDNSWYSVTYGNGLFVAVAVSGIGNRVMTSPDGITWTIRDSAADNNWWTVTYGNGLFVAVSNGGAQRIMTSPDGIVWTARTAPAARSWFTVTYGNNVFVAVSNEAYLAERVMTSPNGIDWTMRSGTGRDAANSVVFADGLFVVVGDDSSTGKSMTSPDGITWTTASIPPVFSQRIWTSVAHGNGVFVAVSRTGTGNRAMSTTAAGAVTPTFSTPVRTANGYTVDVTNYDSNYTFTPSVSTGSVSAGTASGSTLPLTVTGVSAGSSATLTVSTSRSGFPNGAGLVVGTALLAALTPTFSVPVATADGFTVNVTNHSASYAFTPSVSAGSVSAGTASGSTLPLTVTGLSTGASATVTVATSRTGYANGSATVSGSAVSAGLMPMFSTPVATADGFTVNVMNYSASYTFTPSVSSGSVSAGTASGSTLPLTVTGLSAGASATVTVATTRTGYANGSSTVSGTALDAALTPTFSTPVATAAGFTVNVTNYDAAFTFTPSVSSGSVSAGTSSGSTLPLTVTGLSAGASATVTVATTRTGYANGLSTVTGTAQVAVVVQNPSSANPPTSSTPPASPSSPTPAVAPAAPVTDAGKRPVLAPPPTPTPQLLKPTELENLERPPGRAIVTIDGKETPVLIQRTTAPSPNVQPQNRSTSEIAEIRRQGRTVFSNLLKAAPKSTDIGLKFIETSVGAVLRGAGVDPRDGKTPLDVPVEDVLVVGAGAVKMLVTGVDSRGGIAKVQRNGSLIVGRGGYVSLSAFGMTPGATGEIIVMSTPRVLGTFVVAEDGSFTGQVRLPDDIEGEHTVTLVAGSVVVSLGVEVATTRSVEGVAQGGTLPMSGSDSMPVSFLALLLIGVGLLIQARQRRFHLR